MIPAIDHPAWRKLIVGETQVESAQFGFNLLLTNNRVFYRKDSSPAKVQELIKQTYEFMAKNEKLYQTELQQIFGKDYHFVANKQKT